MTERQAGIVRILTVAAITLIVVLVISLIASVATVGSLRARKRSLQRQYSALTARNKSLEGEIGYKSTDAYIEQYAREVLDMIKRGEKVIIIKP